MFFFLSFSYFAFSFIHFFLFFFLLQNFALHIAQCCRLSVCMAKRIEKNGNFVSPCLHRCLSHPNITSSVSCVFFIKSPLCNLFACAQPFFLISISFFAAIPNLFFSLSFVRICSNFILNFVVDIFRFHRIFFFFVPSRQRFSASSSFELLFTNFFFYFILCVHLPANATKRSIFSFFFIHSRCRYFSNVVRVASSTLSFENFSGRVLSST